jgi:hypothetical protein
MDVKLGRLLGYDLTLKDVPEIRKVHVERIAKQILKDMEEKYHGEKPDISIID